MLSPSILLLTAYSIPPVLLRFPHDAQFGLQDYVDDILAAYVLWIILLVMTVMVLYLNASGVVSRVTRTQPDVTATISRASPGVVRTVATVHVISPTASQRPMLTTCV